MSQVKVLRRVLEKNENQASLNRSLFKDKGVLVINIMGTPGAGKTTFIESAIKSLDPFYKVGVIEGDYEGSVDAERLKRLKVSVVQLNVNSCHLNASFVYEGVKNLPLDELDVIFIENVGNLICPAGFDLGEGLRITLYSVPEGDDKPIKYPVMFSRTHAIILTKCDMLPYFDFNINRIKDTLLHLNPEVKLFKFSVKEPFPDDVLSFLRDSINRFKFGQ